MPNVLCAVCVGQATDVTSADQWTKAGLPQLDTTQPLKDMESVVDGTGWGTDYGGESQKKPGEHPNHVSGFGRW